MRAVFLGSPSFAVPALLSLVENQQIDVALVVTQPDRPAGRGRKLTAPPVKLAAVAAGLPLLQPATLDDPDTIERVRATRPELLVVVAYGEILRRNMLSLAPHGCINVHPSLLPRYRGATPIPQAILNGDITTGVSIIKLERRLDAGPLLAQRAVAIDPRDTTGTLGDRLALHAAEMLPKTTLDYVHGLIEPASQDDSLATYTREWSAADARIDWSRTAEDVDRLVRASHPWPVAWSTLAGDRFRILQAEVDVRESHDLMPGSLDTSSAQPRVAAGSGWLRLITVQPAGRRPMPARDWLRGSRLMSTRFDEA